MAIYDYQQRIIGKFQRSFTQIRQIVAKKKGIVIIFQDEQNAFLPSTAAASLNDEKRSAPVIEPSPQLASRFQQDATGGTLYFTLPDSHIGEIFKQCYQHLYRNPAYWKLQWLFLTIVGLVFLNGLLHKNKLLISFSCLVILFMAFQLLFAPKRFLKLGRQGKLSIFAGPQIGFHGGV